MNINGQNLASTALALCLASAAWTPAHAAEWQWIPDIGLYAATIDNARIDSEMEESSSRSVLDARLLAIARGPRGEFRAEPRARIDVYQDSDDSELDGEDFFLPANGVYRWNAARVGFRANLSLESILRSETPDALFDDPDAPDPIDTESGVTEVFDESRTRIAVRPYAEFILSPRSSLLVETGYTDVSYSGPDVASRTEFDALQLSAGIVRRVDERNRVTARMFTSDYQADLTDNNTDTVGVEGEFRRVLNEAWSMTITAGVQRNEFTVDDPANPGEKIDNATTNDTLGLSLRRRTERHTLNFSITRSVQPNASGFVVERDQLWFYAERLFTPRLTGRFGLRAYETTTLDDVQDRNNRDDIRAELNIAWSLTQNWSLEAGYNYLNREFEFENRDADSNEIFIGINYRGLAR